MQVKTGMKHLAAVAALSGVVIGGEKYIESLYKDPTNSSDVSKLDAFATQSLNPSINSSLIPLDPLTNINNKLKSHIRTSNDRLDLAEPSAKPSLKESTENGRLPYASPNPPDVGATPNIIVSPSAPSVGLAAPIASPVPPPVVPKVPTPSEKFYRAIEPDNVERPNYQDLKEDRLRSYIQETLLKSSNADPYDQKIDDIKLAAHGIALGEGTAEERKKVLASINDRTPEIVTPRSNRDKLLLTHQLSLHPAVLSESHINNFEFKTQLEKLAQAIGADFRKNGLEGPYLIECQSKHTNSPKHSVNAGSVKIYAASYQLKESEKAEAAALINVYENLRSLEQSFGSTPAVQAGVMNLRESAMVIGKSNPYLLNAIKEHIVGNYQELGLDIADARALYKLFKDPASFNTKDPRGTFLPGNQHVEATIEGVTKNIRSVDLLFCTFPADSVIPTLTQNLKTKLEVLTSEQLQEVNLYLTDPVKSPKSAKLKAELLEIIAQVSAGK